MSAFSSIRQWEPRGSMANLPWPEVAGSQWHLVQQTKGQTLAEGNKTSGNKSQFEGLVDGAYCMSTVFSLLWQKSGGKGMGRQNLLSAHLGYLRTPQLTRHSPPSISLILVYSGLGTFWKVGGHTACS